MTTNPQEVPDFVGGADSLLINPCTFGPVSRGTIDGVLPDISEEG